MTSPVMGTPFLVGIDVGTQSIRTLLADMRGRTIACATRPTPTRHHGHGCAGYDAEELWETVLDALSELARAVPPGGAIAGIATASMGEACVLVGAAGNALTEVITWFDRRTEGVAAEFVTRAGTGRLFAVCGLPADPTLTLLKLLWYRASYPDLFARARRFLNIADWISFRLSGEAATDFSLASRTLCLDLRARRWSDEVIALAGLDPALFPPIRASGSLLGPVRKEVLEQTGLPGRPVVGVGGHDHVCGGFAAGATRPGVLLDSLGTAEALFLTVAQPSLTERTEQLGFWQGAIDLHRGFGYIGTGINSSGGAIEWLRGVVGAPRAALFEEAALVTPGSEGTCFLPHLAYAPSPRLDTASRGAFVGLTGETTRAAMFRAVLEGLAMEARVVVDAMAALPGVGAPVELRAIGGNSRNELFLRIKASVFNRTLTVVNEPEATALGAALMGGLAAGLWPDLDAALDSIEQPRRDVAPDPAWAEAYAELFQHVYEPLYPALRSINHALTSYHATHAG
jgi:xylulokinase